MSLGVKICRLHRILKRNGYCLKCKAELEKRRYDENPDYQRRRKRNEYHAKRKPKEPLEELMADTQCEHDDALAVEESDRHPSQRGTDDVVYFCPDCGDYLNDSGEVVDDPTEPRKGASQAGKAPRPLAKAQRAKVRPNYSRNVTTKITVKCSWAGCEETFLLYPQNVRRYNWCPKKHRTVMRRTQSRQRQETFRQKHGPRS